MPKYGLIGHPLGHSFSKQFFNGLYQQLELTGYSYENYDLDNIENFPELIREQQLAGVNVTVPYKTAVIPFLDELDETASEVGAVNTVCISSGIKKGYNTDVIGFRKSIEPLVDGKQLKALVFGTGGSSKAVQFVLNDLDIEYLLVSRNESSAGITYSTVSAALMNEHLLLINCTPAGMFPDVHEAVDIPYHLVTDQHIAFDLIYNPQVTLFLERCKEQGAVIKNGAEMLGLQAQASFMLWQQVLAE